MDDSWLTEKQLLALIAEAGYPDVTPWQIDRWRKRRLFSAKRPSRGWYGSETVYPPETVQCVLAICRLKQRFQHNLELLRFMLWCEGYSVPLPDLKRAIKRFVGKPLQLLSIHATGLPAVAKQVLQHHSRHLSRTQGGRYLKEHLQTEEQRVAVLTSALQLAQGDTSVFQDKDGDAANTGQALAELWERLFGFEHARSDHLDANGPWLTGNVAEALASTAQEGLFSLPQTLQTLEDASAHQLMQVREDLATFRLLQPAAEALEISFGPNAFGWGIFRDFSDDPWFLVQLLLSLLQMRKKGYDTQIAIVGKALKLNDHASRRQIALIAALSKEVPAFARLLTGDQKRSEPVTPQSYERRIERLRALRPRFQKELDAFFQRHPEFSSAPEEASATSTAVDTETGQSS